MSFESFRSMSRRALPVFAAFLFLGTAFTASAQASGSSVSSSAATSVNCRS